MCRINGMRVNGKMKGSPEMGKVKSALQIAQNETGYSYYADVEAGSKYGRWAAAYDSWSYLGANGVPYCAMFVSWVLYQAGVPNIGHQVVQINTETMRNAAASDGRLVPFRDAQPGDLILYDWDEDGRTDHIGFFVRETENGTVRTIEGNTSRSDGRGDGYVSNKERPIDNAVFPYLMRPYYEDAGAFTPGSPVWDGETPFPDYPTGQVEVDGYWGARTTTALQQVYGQTVDGVISSQDRTWQAQNPGLTSGWNWVGDAEGSQIIMEMQRRYWNVSPADGLIGPTTIRAMQRHYGTTVDGVIDEGSQVVMALQRDINAQFRAAPGAGGKPGSGTPQSPVVQDGYWGSGLTRALQRAYSTPVDGVVSSQPIEWKAANPGLTSGWEWSSDAVGSQIIARLQRVWGVEADGLIGPNTIRAMQRYYGTTADGMLDEQSSVILALQRELNRR
ncbi:MAG: CHAP domain-containing protein [Actinomyces sp.]|nr:CHAP domain-containing protein [Actinomyces sp.]MCI1829827.1 CHAP domain-containing protein [Actinomyces sp.]